MDWVKQNKFLAGYVGVLVVGIILLTVLLLTSRSAANKAVEEYDNVAKTVESLKSRPLYPKKENLTLIEETREDLTEAVDALQTKLAEFQIPLATGMTDRDFQDKLTDRIVALNGAASRRGVAIPEGFALGFDQYTGTLPRPEAVPKLDFSLEAIDRVINLLVDEGVEELVEFERQTLPVESAAPAPQEEEGSSRRRSSSSRNRDEQRGSSSAATPQVTAIEEFPFRVEFKSSPGELQRVLTALANPAEGEAFYNVDLLSVRSNETDGPPKSAPPEVVILETEEEEAEPVEGEVDLSADVPEGQEDSRLILGNDVLTVIAHMKALRFVSEEDEQAAAEDEATEEGAEAADPADTETEETAPTEDESGN